MRFSAAVVVASGASAYAAVAPTPSESTATVVNTVSVIDCGPDVTDCPGKTMATEPATTPEAEEPMTTSTVYEEHLKTIIDCGVEVVDCPAHSTIVVTETVAVSTTVCPVGETTSTASVVVPPPAEETPSVPEHPEEPECPGSPHCPEEPSEGGDNSPEEPECPGSPHCPEEPSEGGDNSPEEPEEPECVPSYTVTHITKEHVTTVTTVETATVPVDCPGGEETPSVPTGGVTSVVPPAESTPAEGGNPPASTETPPTAGAAGLTASAAFAAVAGLFALLA